LPALAQKSARQLTRNTKTVVVVVVARIVVVAISGTAIIRIIDERTASFFLLVPSLFYFGFWILDFGFVLFLKDFRDLSENLIPKSCSAQNLLRIWDFRLFI
jgi:hypothetical protein